MPEHASITPAFVRRLLAVVHREAAEDKVLGLLGRAVDHASDLGDETGLELAASTIEVVLARELTSPVAATLHYFHANAWGSLRHLRQGDMAAAWAWESVEHEREILSARRALGHAGFAKLDVGFQCRVLTNLANVLSNIGRFIEAIEYYDRAIALDAGFGMALGNKGMCLTVYAREHYEPGHQCIFAGRATQLLEMALQCPLEAPDARAGFVQHLETARRHYQGHTCAADESLHHHSLGSSPEEQRFRSWCLRHRLFVNPLNDLGPVAIAGWDYLLLPTVTVSSQIGTGFHGFYNQLKQEYAAARWLYYEATELPAPSFVDLELNLLDTLDRSVFGIQLEKTKLALRSAYSLFDKVAKFVALYIGLDLHRTYFRWFWYDGKGQHRHLRKEFAGRENLALRALFWLSKDLADDREDNQQHAALEPDAQRIATIRNELEHSYLKVKSSSELFVPEGPIAPPDPFAYPTTEDELRAKTLRVLKMVRSSLIYLSLAVHRDERAKERPESGLVCRGALDAIR
jgi:tetratricopeptide (TPR) repeat protein